MRVEYVNILSAKENHWEKYFEFYKNQGIAVKELMHKNINDFRKSKLEQSAKSESDNFIFFDENSCKANIFLFGNDIKHKTLDVKINFLDNKSDKYLTQTIIEFLHRLLQNKIGYSLIISSTQKIITTLADSLKITENNEFFISRLYRKDIEEKKYSDTFENLRHDFKDFTVNKFTNYGNCNLNLYKDFLDDLRPDIESISEGRDIEVTLEDLQMHMQQLNKENRQRISYIMSDKNGVIIAATNFELRGNIIYTSITGVIKKLRGQKIAEYLKTFSILNLMETKQDFEYIQTRMNSTNSPIFSLNNKLGFKIHETSYEFVLK